MHHSALFCHQYALRIVLSQTFETPKFALTAACGVVLILGSVVYHSEIVNSQVWCNVQSITYKPCI